MIGTLPANVDPIAELRKRLESLVRDEIPRLEQEGETGSEVSLVALGHARQEVDDILTLLRRVDACRVRRRHDDVVELNDVVVIRASRSRKTETMFVHEGGLQIRAPGFISSASPLGAALVGRRVGDKVQVRCKGGSSPRFVIEHVRCA